MIGNRRILVTFCNRWKLTDAEFQGCVGLVIDFRNRRNTPLIFKIEEIPEIGGATGCCVFPGGMAVLLQTRVRSFFALLDEDMKVVKTRPLLLAGDAHSMVYRDGRFLVAATGLDRVVEVDMNLRETVIFDMTGANRDTVHLNGICLHGDDIVISGFGEKTGTYWNSATDGFLYNVTKGEFITRGIFHPHAVMSDGERLLYCESSHKRVADTDGVLVDGINGYCRGLDIADGVMVVGSGKGRKTSRSTGDVVDNVAMRGEVELVGTCGLHFFQMEGRTPDKPLGFMDLSRYAEEVFDVVVF